MTVSRRGFLKRVGVFTLALTVAPKIVTELIPKKLAVPISKGLGYTDFVSWKTYQTSVVLSVKNECWMDRIDKLGLEDYGRSIDVTDVLIGVK